MKQNNLQQLKNPKTDLYLNLKNFILSDRFPWYWNPKSTHVKYDKSKYVNVSFYSHMFLGRPEDSQFKFPQSNCEHTEGVSKVLLEILYFNNIKINCFLRINANCVHPSTKILKTVPHVDHLCDHNNLIVYLTDSGGKTIVGNESHNPKEDDAILFDGSNHYAETPEKERRIILIATFF